MNNIERTHHQSFEDIKQIDKYRNNLKNKILRFTKPLVIQTAYFTVFNKEGQTFFRKDIYGYDRMIESSVSVIEEESDDMTLY